MKYTVISCTQTPYDTRYVIEWAQWKIRKSTTSIIVTSTDGFDREITTEHTHLIIDPQTKLYGDLIEAIDNFTKTPNNDRQNCTRKI